MLCSVCRLFIRICCSAAYRNNESAHHHRRFADYKNLLQLDYDNKRTQANAELKLAASLEEKTPLELIGDFYRLQNNQELSEEQKQYLTDLLADFGGEGL